MWNSRSQRFNCRGVRAAGTPAIAAPGALYAVDFSQLMKNAELLPPAAADCAAGKIDEHREDESSELRRQPVHETGAAPNQEATGWTIAYSRGPPLQFGRPDAHVDLLDASGNNVDLLP